MIQSVPATLLQQKPTATLSFTKALEQALETKTFQWIPPANPSNTSPTPKSLGRIPEDHWRICRLSSTVLYHHLVIKLVKWFCSVQTLTPLWRTRGRGGNIGKVWAGVTLKFLKLWKWVAFHSLLKYGIKRLNRLSIYRIWAVMRVLLKIWGITIWNMWEIVYLTLRKSLFLIIFKCSRYSVFFVCSLFNQAQFYE